MFEVLKRDWRGILVQSVLTAVLLVLFIWGLSIALGATARNERVDQATTRIVEEVQSVRDLLCEALSLADNEHLAEAVERNCTRHDQGT